nr:DUF6735 family protein [Halorussus salinisoli]
MGHRALLAYRRDDDPADSTDEHTGSTDDSHDSTDDTDPSTGDRTDSSDDLPTTCDATYDLHRSHWGGADFALSNRLSADDPFAAETAFAVDSEPIATDVSLSDVSANYLDFLHHEAFYRVGTDYRTTAFHVCWFGLKSTARPSSGARRSGTAHSSRPAPETPTTSEAGSAGPRPSSARWSTGVRSPASKPPTASPNASRRGPTTGR